MSCTQEWRKCHICGDEVLWQTNGIGWHPIQYHDCKPVPRARLEQAERERDEARAERDEAMRQGGAFLCVPHADLEARFAQAVALLGEVFQYEGSEGFDQSWKERCSAFTAGQPAPAQVVDDAMVERAWARVARPGCGIASVTPVDMRAALVAALEGRA